MKTEAQKIARAIKAHQLRRAAEQRQREEAPRLMWGAGYRSGIESASASPVMLPPDFQEYVLRQFGQEYAERLVEKLLGNRGETGPFVFQAAKEAIASTMQLEVAVGGGFSWTVEQSERDRKDRMISVTLSAPAVTIKHHVPNEVAFRTQAAPRRETGGAL
jgi:hypothetical protein